MRGRSSSPPLLPPSRIGALLFLASWAADSPLLPPQLRRPLALFPPVRADVDSGGDVGAAAAASADAEEIDAESEYATLPCSLYLAESTTPPYGRLGLYSAVPLEAGDTLDGVGDVVVPLVDIRRGDDDDGSEIERQPFLFDTYGLDATGLGGAVGFEGRTVRAAALGVAALASGHTGHHNAELTAPSTDGAGLHRSRDAGSGAFSAHHGTTVRLTRPVPAGTELLPRRDPDWFDRWDAALSREGGARPPTAEEYEAADVVVRRVVGLFDSHPDVLAGKGMKGDIVNLIGSAIAKPIRDLIPWGLLGEKSDPAAADDGNGAGTGGIAGTAVLALEGRGRRTARWLRENGICADNVRVGRSRIPQAGRGAFASRFIGEGSVVAPAPVLHVRRERLEVAPDSAGLGEDGEDGEDGTGEGGGGLSFVRNFFSQRGKRGERWGRGSAAGGLGREQLLLNYCFGHPWSSVLLCPAGVVSGYINHSREPNARIAWSSSESSKFHIKEALELTPLQLGGEVRSVLMLEYVALRDIQEGEEIFIDYGAAWEGAWGEHLSRWEATAESKSYVSALMLNENEDGKEIRTEAEQRTIPYPANTELACKYWYRKPPDQESMNGEGELEWNGEQMWRHGHRCSVLRREQNDDGEVRYAALLLDVPGEESVVLRDVPREAIFFVDKPYTSDQHLVNAFRHEIVAPDGIYPKEWLDLAPEQEL